MFVFLSVFVVDRKIYLVSLRFLFVSTSATDYLRRLLYRYNEKALRECIYPPCEYLYLRTDS